MISGFVFFWPLLDGAEALLAWREERRRGCGVGASGSAWL